MAFYGLDPWGDQRADLRMAKIMGATLAPHTKTPVDCNDFLPYPDEAHKLPEDVTDHEKAMMLKLSRLSG